MSGNYNSGSPIYSQLVDGLCKKICNGSLEPGQRILPVRELAAQLGVNPNTMQKALAELETMGLVYAERTSGRYVTKDEGVIIRHRLKMMQELSGRFLYEMMELGCTKDEVVQIIALNAEQLTSR